MHRRDVKSLWKALDILDGRPPFDSPKNTARADSHFAASIEARWGAPLAELRRRAQTERRNTPRRGKE